MNYHRLEYHLRYLIKRSLGFQRKKVYARVACLGNQLFNLRYSGAGSPILINNQKLRIDLFLDHLKVSSSPVHGFPLKYLKRRDIYPLVIQQSVINWNMAIKMDYFMMDSFSELTDQKFTHCKEGWSFCCHYSDLNHDSDFDNYFRSDGLLPLEDIETTYSSFFNWFSQMFPSTEIYFFHFPTCLDSRIRFKLRSAEIIRVMKFLEEKMPFIRNIRIDDFDISAPTTDSFPYHFSEKTLDCFLTEWLKSASKNRKTA